MWYVCCEGYQKELGAFPEGIECSQEDLNREKRSYRDLNPDQRIQSPL